jgi:hypothetical protein
MYIYIIYIIHTYIHTYIHTNIHTHTYIYIYVYSALSHTGLPEGVEVQSVFVLLY